MRLGYAQIALVCLAAVAWTAPASATWSIVVADSRTREVGVAGATCLLEVDLIRALPMVLVERGVAACQSRIDSGAANRIRIRSYMLQDIAPADMLPLIQAADVQFFQQRQFGIVDTQGRFATFTGSQAGAFAGGLVGRAGDLAYAIQGNVITGASVLEAAENALLTTPGDMPAKLLAAMQAARGQGGDGRCSCNPTMPTACGAPPPEFDRSAHVAFFIVARRGDTDGICNFSGCAEGSYLYRLNVYRVAAGPDPVDTLQDLFDTRRAELIAIPDQVQSTVSIPPLLPPDAEYVAPVTVTLRDWQGTPLPDDSAEIPTVEILSDPRDGSGLISGGFATWQGDGTYVGQVRSSATPGTDVVAVRVTHGGVSRILTPATPVRVQHRGDLDGNGVVSVGDIGAFVLALTDPAEYAVRYPQVVVNIVGDLTGDGAVTPEDIAPFVNLLINRPE
jgi:uncharacterized Ntn-hydrolase superfamily protein